MSNPRDILNQWVSEAREVFVNITVMDCLPAIVINTTRIVPKKDTQSRVKKAKRKSQHKNQEILI